MQTDVFLSVNFAITSYYNCDVYGGGGYGEGSKTICSSSSPDPTTNTGGGTDGLLANTGDSILIPLAFGALLIASALVLLIKTRQRAKKR